MANAIISANAPELNVINGLPVVSSLAIAENFEKQHCQVLRDIRTICDDIPDDLRESNFVSSQYEGKTPTGGTRKYPMFMLTRDGFTLVAMGFTGKKALAWKIKYIQAFNEMERALLEGKHGEPVSLPKKKALGRGIKALPPAKEQPVHVFKRMGLTPLEELQMGTNMKRMFDGLDMDKIGPHTMEALAIKVKYMSAINEIYQLNRQLVGDLDRFAPNVNGQALKALNKNKCFSDPFVDTLYEARYRIDNLNEEYRSQALAALNSNICLAMMLGA